MFGPKFRVFEKKIPSFFSQTQKSVQKLKVCEKNSKFVPDSEFFWFFYELLRKYFCKNFKKNVPAPYRHAQPAPIPAPWCRFRVAPALLYLFHYCSKTVFVINAVFIPYNICSIIQKIKYFFCEEGDETIGGERKVVSSSHQKKTLFFRHFLPLEGHYLFLENKKYI